MQKVNLNDRVIYRASKGKKVKFLNDKNSYSEIVVKHETDKIVEVDE